MSYLYKYQPTTTADLEFYLKPQSEESRVQIFHVDFSYDAVPDVGSEISVVLKDDPSVVLNRQFVELRTGMQRIGGVSAPINRELTVNLSSGGAKKHLYVGFAGEEAT